jgi:glycosyltransferase involved in cell wall biosynthesis
LTHILRSKIHPINNSKIATNSDIKPSLPNRQYRVVVAIPCYNNEKYISGVVLRVRNYAHEVIVIDDGSDDKTAEMALAGGAKVIQHPVNLGKGAAMKTAIKQAKGDILVFIDGDGQHKPEEMPSLLAPIVQGKADFVIGSRFLPGSQLHYEPLHRGIANTIASFVISCVISFLLPIARFFSNHGQIKRENNNLKKGENWVSENLQADKKLRIINGWFKWISDCTSGFTAMKLENVSKLNLTSNGFQIETEMIFEQAKNGYIIAETPISCNWDEKTSKLSIFRDGSKTIMLICRKLVKFGVSNV